MNSYATNIAIGGTLPATKLKDLLRAVAQSRVGLDWNEATIGYHSNGLQELSDGNDAAAANGEPLRLYSDAATNGRLDAIESFCTTHGLSYRSESDPDHGENGMVRWWTPGMAKPGEREADSDGEPFIHVKDVVAALDAANDAEAAVAALRDLVDQATPVEVPPLVLESE